MDEPYYKFLGLSVGIIQHFLPPPDRREAYASDVTYVTNNEAGFDYLRDNMAPHLAYCVQRELNYAIVDEVDSILIDEARTPLIISGSPEAVLGPTYKDPSHLYEHFARNVMPQLRKDEDYTVDEKMHAVPITEAGVAKVEKILGVHTVGQPFTAQTDGPAYKTMTDALEKAFGDHETTEGQGGSIPLCNTLHTIYPDAEIMLTGDEEPRCLIHAPNESVDPAEIERIALAEALFLQQYGAAAQR